MTDRTLNLVSTIVSSYVAYNAVRADDLIALIQSVHATIDMIDQPAPVAEPLVPSVSINKSVTRDHIVCLEDGKKFKSLKRHLMTSHDMTPNEYRKKRDLPASYPMNAQALSDMRSGQALGNSFGAPLAKRGRPRKVT